MEPYIGQICIFPYPFTPKGWVKCDGQLLEIQQHSSLFALLGTTYGGDGYSTFGVPDLRGRVVVGQGQGPGLSDYSLGYPGGLEYVGLDINQMPQHSHQAQGSVQTTIKCKDGDGDTDTPKGNYAAKYKINKSEFAKIYSTSADSVMSVSESTVNIATNDAGGSQLHYNMQPFLTIGYYIATEGVFPSRN